MWAVWQPPRPSTIHTSRIVAGHVDHVDVAQERQAGCTTAYNAVRALNRIVLTIQSINADRAAVVFFGGLLSAFVQFHARRRRSHVMMALVVVAAAAAVMMIVFGN